MVYALNINIKICKILSALDDYFQYFVERKSNGPHGKQILSTLGLFLPVKFTMLLF